VRALPKTAFSRLVQFRKRAIKKSAAWSVGNLVPPTRIYRVQEARIHKLSAAVSFGLPASLSFLIREHAMVAADRGQTSTGKASGVRLQSGLTSHLGECNAFKNKATKV
jgi:hypothetical protein